MSIETSARVASTNRPAEQGGEQAAREEAPALSFAELKALIEQGKTDGIPNNKFIPNTLNVSLRPKPLSRYFRSKPQALQDAPPSESTGQIRTKPWEM